MTDQERDQVLKMIEEGKITPEEGLQLMQALDQAEKEERLPSSEGSLAPSAPLTTAEPADASGEAPQAEESAKSSFENDERIEQMKANVQRLWEIPLWIGLFITVMSAWGMYAIMHSAGTNFWFYFLLLPLLIGVLVIVAALASRQARWLYVDVQQKPGARPHHIFLGFPLPIKLAAWFLRTFSPVIPGLRETKIDDAIQVLETGLKGDQPLIVNVDEGHEGERVRVFIG